MRTIKIILLNLIIFVLITEIKSQDYRENFIGIYNCQVKRSREYPANPNTYNSLLNGLIYVNIDSNTTNKVIIMDSIICNDNEIIIDTCEYYLTLDTNGTYNNAIFGDYYLSYGSFYNLNDSLSMQNYSSGLFGSICFYYNGKRLSSSNTDHKKPNRIIKVYPNPAINNLYICLPDENDKEKGIFEFFDLTGKCILQEEAKTINNIDISSLQNGIYFLKIKYKNLVYFEKIIKN